MNWIKKNWMLLALVILVIILFGDRACKSSSYKKDIKNLDEEISVLEDNNKKLEDTVYEAVERAKRSAAIVAEKEASIREKDIIIVDLRKKREEVIEVVISLPPSELVEKTREILDCAEIELTPEGILFSVECARASLTMIAQFSLIKQELGETRFSLSESITALEMQKRETRDVYKIAWAQGKQILNYKEIIGKKDLQFSLCEKQRKRSWFSGLWKGFLIGVAVGVVVSASFKFVIK